MFYGIPKPNACSSNYNGRLSQSLFLNKKYMNTQYSKIDVFRYVLTKIKKKFWKGLYIAEGKFAILAAVQASQLKVLEILFNWGANPVHLSINQGDTPIHAALSIALGGDKGDYINSNVYITQFFFWKLYDNLSMKNYYSYIICQKPDVFSSPEPKD